MAQVYSKLFKGGRLSASHLKMINLIDSGDQVLELGASSGYITRKLFEKGCLVDIVEKDSDDANKALKFSRKGFVGSLEDDNFLKQINSKYDVILAADVLEHLQNPNILLIFLKSRLKPGAKIIISLPNVACWSSRCGLFFKGRFEYQDSGLFDRTHLRFYTLNSFRRLLLKSGYKVRKTHLMESSYPFKFNILKLRIIGSLLDRLISRVLYQISPNLFVYHMVFEAYAKR